MRHLMCLFSIVLTLFAGSVAAQSTVILQNDFEEKKTEGWESRGTGGVSIKTTDKQAANGERSLQVRGRSANWHGTQLNVTKLLSPGNTYTFTVSVRLDKGEKPDEVKMTMQRGDTGFDTVGVTNANADSWTTFSGKFRPTGNDPYLLLYVEAIRERTAFFIDDFKVELTPDVPDQKGILLKNDFEDATAQNWFVRGDGVQMFSTNAGGSRSLKVADRSQKWHGLALDVSPKIYKGRKYQFSVSVKLVQGQPADKLKVTIQQTPPQGDPTYVEIVPATGVTDAEWVTLSGEYEATTDNNNLLVIVEAEGATTAFYLDNFELKIP